MSAPKDLTAATDRERSLAADATGAAPPPPEIALGLSANALRVLQARYLRRDEQRVVTETPDEMFARVARAAAGAELVFGGAHDAVRWEEEFTQMLRRLDFLPNSPTLTMTMRRVAIPPNAACERPRDRERR